MAFDTTKAQHRSPKANALPSFTAMKSIVETGERLELSLASEPKFRAMIPGLVKTHSARRGSQSLPGRGGGDCGHMGLTKAG